MDNSTSKPSSPSVEEKVNDDNLSKGVAGTPPKEEGEAMAGMGDVEEQPPVLTVGQGSPEREGVGEGRTTPPLENVGVVKGRNTRSLSPASSLGSRRSSRRSSLAGSRDSLHSMSMTAEMQFKLEMKRLEMEERREAREMDERERERETAGV